MAWSPSSSDEESVRRLLGPRGVPLASSYRLSDLKQQPAMVTSAPANLTAIEGNSLMNKVHGDQSTVRLAIKSERAKLTALGRTAGLPADGKISNAPPAPPRRNANSSFVTSSSEPGARPSPRRRPPPPPIQASQSSEDAPGGSRVDPVLVSRSRLSKLLDREHSLRAELGKPGNMRETREESSNYISSTNNVVKKRVDKTYNDTNHHQLASFGAEGAGVRRRVLQTPSKRDSTATAAPTRQLIANKLIDQYYAVPVSSLSIRNLVQTERAVRSSLSRFSDDLCDAPTIEAVVSVVTKFATSPDIASLGIARLGLWIAQVNAKRDNQDLMWSLDSQGVRCDIIPPTDRDEGVDLFNGFFSRQMKSDNRDRINLTKCDLDMPGFSETMGILDESMQGNTTDSPRCESVYACDWNLPYALLTSDRAKDVMGMIIAGFSQNEGFSLLEGADEMMALNIIHDITMMVSAKLSELQQADEIEKNRAALEYEKINFAALNQILEVSINFDDAKTNNAVSMLLIDAVESISTLSIISCVIEEERGKDVSDNLKWFSVLLPSNSGQSPASKVSIITLDTSSPLFHSLFEGNKDFSVEIVSTLGEISAIGFMPLLQSTDFSPSHRVAAIAIPLDYAEASKRQYLVLVIDADKFRKDSIQDLYRLLKYLRKTATSAYHRIALANSESIRISMRTICADIFSRMKNKRDENALVRLAREVEQSDIKSHFTAKSSKFLFTDDLLVRSGVNIRHKSGAPIRGRISEGSDCVALCCLGKEGSLRSTFELLFDNFDTNASKAQSDWRKSLIKGEPVAVNSLYFDSGVCSHEDWSLLKHFLRNIEEDCTSYLLIPIIRSSVSTASELVGILVLCGKKSSSSLSEFDAYDIDTVKTSCLQSELSTMVLHAAITSLSGVENVERINEATKLSPERNRSKLIENAIDSFKLDISAAVDAGAASEVTIDRIIALNVGLLFQSDQIEVTVSEIEHAGNMPRAPRTDETQISVTDEKKSDCCFTQLQFSIECSSECIEVLVGKHECFDRSARRLEPYLSRRMTQYTVKVMRSGSSSHYVGFEESEINCLQSFSMFLFGYFSSLSSNVTKLTQLLGKRASPYYELHRFILDGFPVLLNQTYGFNKDLKIEDLSYVASWIGGLISSGDKLVVKDKDGIALKYTESPDDRVRISSVSKEAMSVINRESIGENLVRYSLKNPDEGSTVLLEFDTVKSLPDDQEYLKSICMIAAYCFSLTNRISTSANYRKDIEYNLERVGHQLSEASRLLTVEKKITENLRKRLSSVLSLLLLFSKASRISSLDELGAILTEALPSVLGASSLAFFVAEQVINLCTLTDIPAESQTYTWTDTRYMTVGINDNNEASQPKLRATWRQLQNIPEFSACYTSTQVLIPLYLPQRTNATTTDSKSSQDLRVGSEVPFAALLMIMPERKDVDDVGLWAGLEDFLKTSMCNCIASSLERLQNQLETKRACASLTQSFKGEVERLQEHLKTVEAESEQDLSELSDKCSALAAEKSELEEKLNSVSSHCNMFNESLIKLSEIALDEHLDKNSLRWLGRVCASINTVGAYVRRDKIGNFTFEYIENSGAEVFDAQMMNALQSGLLSFAIEAIKLHQVVNSSFESDVNIVSPKVGQVNTTASKKLRNFVLCIPVDFPLASDDKGPVVCCIFTKTSTGSLATGGFQRQEVELLLSCTAAASNIAHKFSAELSRVLGELREHKASQKQKTGLSDLMTRVVSAAMKLWSQNLSGAFKLGTGIENAFSKLFAANSSKPSLQSVKVTAQIFFHSKIPITSEKENVDLRRPKQSEVGILQEVLHSGIAKRDGVILWVPINRQVKEHVQTVAVVRVEKVPILSEYAELDELLSRGQNLSSRSLSELGFSSDEESSLHTLAQLIIPCFDRLNLISSTYQGVKKASRAIEAMQSAQDEVESKLSLEVATKMKLKDVLKHSTFIMDSLAKSENYPSSLHQYDTLRKAILDVLSAQECFVIAPMSYFDKHHRNNESNEHHHFVDGVIDPSQTTTGWLQGVYFTVERDMKAPTDVNLKKSDVEYMSLHFKKHVIVDGSLDDENWISKSWCMRKFVSAQGTVMRSEDMLDIAYGSNNEQSRLCHMCITPFYTNDGSLALAVVIKKRISFTDLDHECISFLLRTSKLSRRVSESAQEIVKVNDVVSEMKTQTMSAISSRDDFVRSQLEALLNGLFIAADSMNDARIIDAATNSAAHYITNEASNRGENCEDRMAHFMDSICSGLNAFGELIFGQTSDVVVEVIKVSEFYQFSRSRAPGLSVPSTSGRVFELSSPGSQLRHYGLESLPLFLAEAGSVSYTSINALYWIYMTKSEDFYRHQESGRPSEIVSAVVSLAIYSKAWNQDAVKVTIALKDSGNLHLDAAYQKIEDFQKINAYMLKVKVAVVLRLLAIHGSWMVSSEATIKDIVKDLTSKADTLSAECKVLQLSNEEAVKTAERKLESSIKKIKDKFKSELFESNRLCKATESYLRTALISVAKSINVSISGKLGNKIQKKKPENPLLLDASVLLKSLVQICADLSSSGGNSRYDICYCRIESKSDSVNPDIAVTWVDTGDSKKDSHYGVYVNKFKKSVISEDSPIHIALTLGSYVLILNESKKSDFVEEVEDADNRSKAVPLIISKSPIYSTGTLFIPVPASGGSKISFVIMMSARKADSTAISGNLISSAPSKGHFSGLTVGNLITCWNSIREVCSALSDQSRALEKFKTQADNEVVKSAFSKLNSVFRKRSFGKLQSSFQVWKRSMSLIAAFDARETLIERQVGSYRQKYEILERSIADWTEAVRSINGAAAGTLTKGLRGFWADAYVSLISLLNGKMDVTGCGLLVANHKNEILDLCVRDVGPTSISLQEGSVESDNIVIRPANELGVEVMTLAWNLLTTDGPQRSKKRFWNMSRTSPYGTYSEENASHEIEGSVEEMWLIPVQTAWDVLGVLRISVRSQFADFRDDISSTAKQNIINFADIIAPIMLAARHIDVAKSREKQLVADMEMTSMQANTSLQTLRFVADGTKRLLSTAEMFCAEKLRELDDLHFQKPVSGDSYLSEAIDEFSKNMCDAIISVLGRDVCIEYLDSDFSRAQSLESNIVRAPLRSEDSIKEDLGNLVVYCDRRMSSSNEMDDKINSVQLVDAVASALPVLASAFVYCYLNMRNLLEKALISRNETASASSSLLTVAQLEENCKDLSILSERNSVINFILEHCSTVLLGTSQYYDDSAESDRNISSNFHAALFKNTIRRAYKSLSIPACAMRIGTVCRDESRTVLETGQVLLAEDTSLNWVFPKAENSSSNILSIQDFNIGADGVKIAANMASDCVASRQRTVVDITVGGNIPIRILTLPIHETLSNGEILAVFQVLLPPFVFTNDPSVEEFFSNICKALSVVLSNEKMSRDLQSQLISLSKVSFEVQQAAERGELLAEVWRKKCNGWKAISMAAEAIVRGVLAHVPLAEILLSDEVIHSLKQAHINLRLLQDKSVEPTSASYSTDALSRVVLTLSTPINSGADGTVGYLDSSIEILCTGIQSAVSLSNDNFARDTVEYVAAIIRSAEAVAGRTNVLIRDSTSQVSSMVSRISDLQTHIDAMERENDLLGLKNVQIVDKLKANLAMQERRNDFVGEILIPTVKDLTEGLRRLVDDSMSPNLPESVARVAETGRDSKISVAELKTAYLIDKAYSAIVSHCSRAVVKGQELNQSYEALRALSSGIALPQSPNVSPVFVSLLVRRERSTRSSSTESKEAIERAPKYALYEGSTGAHSVISDTDVSKAYLAEKGVSGKSIVEKCFKNHGTQELSIPLDEVVVGKSVSMVDLLGLDHMSLASLLSVPLANRGVLRLHICCVSVRDNSISGSGDKLTGRTPAVIRCIWLESSDTTANEKVSTSHLVYIPYLLDAIVSSSIGLLRCISEMSIFESKRAEAEAEARTSRNNIGKLNDHLARWRRLYRIVARESGQLLDPPTVSLTNSLVLPFIANEEEALGNDRVDPPGRLAHPAYLSPVSATQDVCLKILSVCRTLLRTEGQAIFLADVDTSPMSFQVIATGDALTWSGVQIGTIGRVCPAPLSGSLVETAMQSHKHLILEDLSKDDRYLPQVDGACLPKTPCLIVPLRGRSGIVIGALLAARGPEGTHMTTEDVAVAEMMVSMASLSLYWCRGLGAVHVQVEKALDRVITLEKEVETRMNRTAK